MPLNERRLIDRIRQLAAKAEVKGVGIGDDTAVLALPKGHEALVTTDFTLEGVHFRREWHPPDSVGHRCLARGLSDIAAMGGNPRAAFLSLALPSNLQNRWIDGFVRGLLRLAGQYGVQLAGGDTAQSPGGIVADIVVLGSAPAGKAILRSGAKPGDLVYITGTLGASVAALNALCKGTKLRPQSNRKHFYPEPRIAVGQFLRENKLASAMIDISDGLSTDLTHLCRASGVAAEIDEASLPIHPLAMASKQDRLQLALNGGEDYELLFAAAPKSRVPRRIGGVPITRIGSVVQAKRGGPAVTLQTRSGQRIAVEPAGWEHFR